ncbi:MAG: hypothetical protein KKA90_02225 [Nanoarchaeota archaeon]|nr:hypothetical protein [Nanoarchaeota archaeon]
MKAKFGLITFFVLMLTAASAAAIPGVPHQFYGAVQINGAPAPDGSLVVARIQGLDEAATTTSAGTYGIAPHIFYVPDTEGDNDGKQIDFYVNGVFATSFTFVNGGTTTLDLSITQATSPPGGDTGGDTGGGGGGGSFTGSCVEKWECTDWFACLNGKQQRLCVDKNQCNTVENMPLEERTCDFVANPNCVEDWSCSDWSACQFGSQSRVCTDLNTCGTTNAKPEDLRGCGQGPDTPLPITGFFLANPAASAGLGIVVIVLIGGLYFGLRKRRAK